MHIEIQDYNNMHTHLHFKCSRADEERKDGYQTTVQFTKLLLGVMAYLNNNNNGKAEIDLNLVQARAANVYNFLVLIHKQLKSCDIPSSIISQLWSLWW